MKKDVILILILVLLGLGLWGVFGLFSATGEQVCILSDGVTVGTYSLFEDQIVTLPHHVITIANGQAMVTASDCVGQDCVRTPPISRGNQAIVCLPYRVSIKVLSRAGTDTITY